MNKDRVELLLKQKLISRKKLERNISKKYNELFTTHDLSDNEITNELSSFFGVSRLYLEKDFSYHFFLKFGNVIIFALFVICSFLMLFFYFNKSVDLIAILVSSLSTSLVLTMSIFYYRHFRMSVVLFIPLIFAIYLLGIFTFYYKFLGFYHRIPSIFLGTLY